MRLLLALSLAVALAPAADADEITGALEAEVSRNLEGLGLEGLERPYFLGYWLRDQRDLTIQGSLGSILRSLDYRTRIGRIDLRVGSYELDNSGFLSRDRSLASGSIVQLTTGSDPDALRRILWYHADRLYKVAARNLEAKRTYLEQSMGEPDAPDFARVDPVRFDDSRAPEDVRKTRWENRIRSLSARFLDFPEIVDTDVVFFVRDRLERYVSSEGTRVRDASLVYGVEVSATAQASDGMHLMDFAVLYDDRDVSDSRLEEFEAEIEAMASRLVGRLDAPRGEDYLGPVLVEGQAACELLGQLFVPAIAGDRAYISDDDRYAGRFREPALASRLKRRVFPLFLSVFDEPARAEREGVRLLGGYDVDQQGVKPRALQVVDRGILKSLLMGRTPHARIPGSNGHARADNGVPGGRISKPLRREPSTAKCPKAEEGAPGTGGGHRSSPTGSSSTS